MYLLRNSPGPGASQAMYVAANREAIAAYTMLDAKRTSTDREAKRCLSNIASPVGSAERCGAILGWPGYRVFLSAIVVVSKTSDEA